MFIETSLVILTSLVIGYVIGKLRTKAKYDNTILRRGLKRDQ